MTTAARLTLRRLHGGPWDGREMDPIEYAVLGERQSLIVKNGPGEPHSLYVEWADGEYHYQGETDWPSV